MVHYGTQENTPFNTYIANYQWSKTNGSANCLTNKLLIIFKMCFKVRDILFSSTTVYVTGKISYPSRIVFLFYETCS